MPARRCSVCAGGVPRGAAFCPHCGRRIGEESPEAPPFAEAQFYGVTPPMTLLALALGVYAVGVLLLVRDRPVLGAVLISIALVLGVAFVGAVRRRPVPASLGPADRLRERLRLLGTSFSARAAARRDVGRLVREREELGRTREQLLQRIGEAAYAGDDETVRSLRTELEELDAELASKEGEMQAVIEGTHERLQQARLEAQPTEMVEVPEPVPEPSPPPEPAIVPEPTPVPHEPPEPPTIPEPMPEPTPEPGPQATQEAPRARARRRRS